MSINNIINTSISNLSLSQIINEYNKKYNNNFNNKFTSQNIDESQIKYSNSTFPSQNPNISMVPRLNNKNLKTLVTNNINKHINDIEIKEKRREINDNKIYCFKDLNINKICVLENEKEMFNRPKPEPLPVKINKNNKIDYCKVFRRIYSDTFSKKNLNNTGEINNNNKTNNLYKKKTLNTEIGNNFNKSSILSKNKMSIKTNFGKKSNQNNKSERNEIKEYNNSKIKKNNNKDYEKIKVIKKIDEKLIYVLKNLELENLLNRFNYHCIKFQDLFQLSKVDLLEMNLPIGPRNRIFKFINEFKKYAKNFDLDELKKFFENKIKNGIFINDYCEKNNELKISISENNIIKSNISDIKKYNEIENNNYKNSCNYRKIPNNLYENNIINKNNKNQINYIFSRDKDIGSIKNIKLNNEKKIERFERNNLSNKNISILNSNNINKYSNNNIKERINNTQLNNNYNCCTFKNDKNNTESNINNESPYFNNKGYKSNKKMKVKHIFNSNILTLQNSTKIINNEKNNEFNQNINDKKKKFVKNFSYINNRLEIFENNLRKIRKKSEETKKKIDDLLIKKRNYKYIENIRKKNNESKYIQCNKNINNEKYKSLNNIKINENNNMNYYNSNTYISSNNKNIYNF